MKVSTTAFSVFLGLFTLPQSVISFSLSNQKLSATSVYTTELQSTIGDVTPTISKAEPASASTISATSTPAPTKTTTTPSIKSKSKKPARKRKPNKDINFLVKRTNQIISHAPLCNTDSSTDTNNDKEQSITTQTFHWLIDDWTKSLHATAPEHSLSLMNSMKEYGLSPTSKTVTKVILAYAKCGRGGERAEKVLESILEDYQHEEDIRPNAYSYTAVLEAYANADIISVKDATMAEKLMESMIKAAKDGDESMKPNAKSFLALIRTWGAVWDSTHNGIEIGARKAENCLIRMRGLFDDEFIDDSPNLYHHNAILSAWSNSGEEGSAERTEALLFQMEKGADGVNPNTVSYNICIDAYAKDGNGRNAEALLNRMDEFYQTRENRECKPNTRSYNSVMNAYAKSSDLNASFKAEIILRKMESLYKESDETDRDIKPDFISFATVINAWGRSMESLKAEKVLTLYREMFSSYRRGDLSLRPNVFIFNSIMNACAYTIGEPSEQRQAMEIATVMLKELEASSYAKADQITYGTYLKVCQHQMPQSDTRRQLVAIVFNKCIKEGQMGQIVLEQMRALTTRTQLVELLGDSASITSWTDLPNEWTRNVVEGKRYRRQKYS